MGGMNRPTAGARHEAALPKGEHPLQLYSLGTPNGIKVTILLEELGVEYDAWRIDIFKLEQFGSEFVAANPNSKIPALLDYDFDPPVRVFESGHILKYVAEKHGFMPSELREKTEVMNWVFWLQGGAPYVGGGFGHFYNYAPLKIEYAIDRFTLETKRQLDVLDKHLSGREWMCSDFSIADICIWPWIMCLKVFYKADKFLQLDTYANLMQWYEKVKARKSVQRGCRVNGFGDNAIKERHSKLDFGDEEEEQQA
ncbi:hypothetical protein CTAYLR_008527 [Chrysophaeum taylorii]|uniref:Glutathione S-transferase n=1 Tax=Chrysophaeum taylorii TaxID=2483200 RepID=A0AAD7UPK9_9STRA|nr:hypothetical protein CTAYLR_008527 [Chrysophaeum taylorii]